jgi:DMSO/TMAO reductase YedYZ molybdopterin-dependent catalytic subunit
MQRRNVLLGTGAVLGGMATRAWTARAWAEGAATHPGLALGTREQAVMDALPGKQPMIKLTYRPPNYETPLAYLRTPITPNDQFFVRYHLSQLPTMATLADWSLAIGGDAAGKPVKMTLAELNRLPVTEVTAVCQCSGNRRGLSNPHVPGVQWGVGAMGNAVWRGPRLRDVLALAGVGAAAVEIGLAGTDTGVIQGTPQFVKSIPLDRAMDENTIIATSMNGEALPLWNGFPARLIVPGWTATYWMKHLATIDIRSKPETNFWMKAAYRLPTGMFPGSPFPTQDTEVNRPITDIVVNSLVTSHADGDRVAAGRVVLSGIAWDNGSGIAGVEVSTDGGASWKPASLGTSTGRFGFQPWQADIIASAGELAPMIRATAKSGAVQPAKPIFNGAGYHNNAVQTLSLIAA